MDSGGFDCCLQEKSKNAVIKGVQKHQKKFVTQTT